MDVLVERCDPEGTAIVRKKEPLVGNETCPQLMRLTSIYRVCFVGLFPSWSAPGCRCCYYRSSAANRGPPSWQGPILKAKMQADAVSMGKNKNA